MCSNLKAHKKQGHKLNEQQCKVHEELLTQLQTYMQVLNKKNLSILWSPMKRMQFYDHHKQLPNPTKDENFAKLLKQLRYTEWLLAEWQIQL